jgi:hypothetical protein
MIDANCYEQVAGFRGALSLIRSLVGSDLPAGLACRTFDPAGTIGQLNVVGLSCEQGGHEVADALINAPLSVPGTAVRVRTYTSSPNSSPSETSPRSQRSRPPSTSIRARGPAVATSSRLTMVARSHLRRRPGRNPPSASPTLRHLTVKGGEMRGRIE